MKLWNGITVFKNLEDEEFLLIRLSYDRIKLFNVMKVDAMANIHTWENERYIYGYWEDDSGWVWQRIFVSEIKNIFFYNHELYISTSAELIKLGNGAWKVRHNSQIRTLAQTIYHGK